MGLSVLVGQIVLTALVDRCTKGDVIKGVSRPSTSTDVGGWIVMTDTSQRRVTTLIVLPPFPAAQTLL